MDISVFSILTIIMILVATFLFKRKRKAPIHLKEGIPAEDAFTLKTVESCGLVIDKALECLSTCDEIAVCRNHRLGREYFDGLERESRRHDEKTCNPDGKDAAYRSYMVSAADKIAETSRRIVTGSGNGLSLAARCEIDSIRESLGRLLAESDKAMTGESCHILLGQNISKDKDFIEHTIAEHTRTMTKEDYAEGSQSYSYLQLLHYLHSFVNSLSGSVKAVADRRLAPVAVCPA